MLSIKIRLRNSSRPIIFILIMVTIFFFARRIIYSKKYVIVHWVPVTNNITCHYSTEGDALPSAEGASFAPAPRSIFFHETSCRGGLNSRQACAVESAARAHPHRQVHVLFSSPVTEYVLNNSVLGQLQELINVKYARVHIEKYSLGLFPEHLLKELKSSNYSVCHTSDLLRLVTLWKWGGVYLDTDLVVMRSLDKFPPNWAAKQSSNEMANGILALSNDETGRNISAALLKQILETYDPNDFTGNGPELLHDMLEDLCPESLTCAGGHCDKFYIFDWELFYPIYYKQLEEYFEPGRQYIVHNSNYPYVHHFWNGLSWNVSIHNDSPYANLARKYCPSVYELYGDEFGV